MFETSKKTKQQPATTRTRANNRCRLTASVLRKLNIVVILSNLALLCSIGPLTVGTGNLVMDITALTGSRFDYSFGRDDNEGTIKSRNDLKLRTSSK